MDKEGKKNLYAESLKKLVARITQTPDGKAFFCFLSQQCGLYNTSLVWGKDADKLNIEAVIVNETLRNFYLNLRKYIPKIYLSEIENLDLNEYLKQLKESEDL